MKKSIAALLFLLLISSCSEEKTLFQEVSDGHSNITFNNTLTDTPELNILNYLYYYNGAGVIAADFNNDNLIDIFFTGNQVPDALYLNQGDLIFEEVTQKAGISPTSSWSTGASYVDINSDGLLDIYICKAAGYRSLKGKNLLYVNQGLDDNGIPQFKESAEAYGIDFSGLSTKASFFDYDLDGDLDMFLMNHSVHPNRNYGKGSQRKGYNPISGDVLYQNNNGKFIDVSEEAAIFQGKAGYGLGLAISDVNQDGYPDIYVGNDFFENDYFYINQQDGTFQEIISTQPDMLGHTTHFSMGNTITDINNDGWTDILSLDMLPENLVTYKTSGLEYGYPIYRQYLKNGFSPQYMQNTFHLNLDGERFAEIGNLSGISATEWSWGTLAADFNQDGLKDIFVSNGIKGATNDMDFMNFIANEGIQRRIDAGMKKTDLPLVNEIPKKKVPNYFFRNNGDLTFSDVSEEWMKSVPTFSNGCAYADFDNDGDLDLVINHVDKKATLLENTSNQKAALKAKFEGGKNNPIGIGATATVFAGQTIQHFENYPDQGYLSAVPPMFQVNLPTGQAIDSIQVTWPGGQTQTLKSITSNTELVLKQEDASEQLPQPTQNLSPFVVNDSIIPFRHKESVSIDFDGEPLIPYANSNNGPCLAVADVNKDGLDDVFIGGAKNQAGGLFLQDSEGSFESSQQALFETSKIDENTACVFFDFDNDGWTDLLVANGGNEFGAGNPLRPKVYKNQGGELELVSAIPQNVVLNASDIGVGDFNGDGFQDIILVSDGVTRSFGANPEHFLLFNNGKGGFDDVTKQRMPHLANAGNLKDVEVVDIDKDGQLDMITVGHWENAEIHINQKGKFVLQTPRVFGNTKGWWNVIKAADFDKDGDIDLIAGNWGLNTKFKASPGEPITLYRNDFDGNSSVEPVVTYFHQGIETPFASKDALVKQMPFLNKKFLSYLDFANASIEELFGSEALNEATRKQIFELNSCYFENKGDGNFNIKPLPFLAQASQINDILVEDLNEDGYLDVLIVGNNHHISTQLGRLDASHGIFLQNDKKGFFFHNHKQDPSIDGVVQSIGSINLNQKLKFIIGRNNAPALMLSKRQGK
ncbi:MAG: VCBS repeat-containing protein [Bacteroidota bacterium]